MKISDRNTALRYLKEGAPMTCRIMEGVEMDHTARAFLFQGFPEMRGCFRERVQHFSDKFLKAYDEARAKMFDVFVEEPVERQGTFMARFDDSWQGTIFYQMSAKAVGDGCWEIFCTIVVFYSQPGDDLPLVVAIIRRPAIGDDITFVDHHLGGGEMTPDFMVHNVLCLILFMKHCQLETKIVEPGKKTVHVNQKYVNESAQPVEFIDLTWFTTIVRNEGFTVGEETGGFPRWQRYGPGLAQKKRIWVGAYEKKGYTKKARMLLRGE